MAGTVPKLDQDWQEIQNMIQAGIIPSSLRIKEYLENCCSKQDTAPDISKVLNCIAEILRLEEERCVLTESGLKDVLVVLQSGKSSQDLEVALSNIKFLPKEPQTH